MTLDIDIDSDPEWDSSTRWESLVRSAAEAAIAESAFPQIARSHRQIELSIRLTGDSEVQALNAEWRGKDKPTNVLSFPQVDPDRLVDLGNSGPGLILGDLVLARGVCQREAAGNRISLEDHAAHLVVHGTLHLLGYDHQDEQSADEMESLEARALARLSIANPYLETANGNS